MVHCVVCRSKFNKSCSSYHVFLVAIFIMMDNNNDFHELFMDYIFHSTHEPYIANHKSNRSELDYTP